MLNVHRENTAPRAPWWSRLLCWLGCHDWSNMDGVCADPACRYEDPLWPRRGYRSSDRVPPRTSGR